MSWEIDLSSSTPIANGTISAGKPAELLFLGDLHLDNTKADRKAVKVLLDEARERNALVILLGDVFDVMQGYGDRRASLSALRRDYAERSEYIGSVIDDVTDFLAPYARNIWIILQGNHESAVLRHAGVRLEEMLAANLMRVGGRISTPGYQSYAVAKVKYDTDQRTRSFPFWIAHGHGGGGEVTKGVIQAQRRAVTYPDARFVVSGHVHSSYYVAHEQWRLDGKYKPFAAQQEHYVVGTFKDEFSSAGGYHVEKGRGPRLPSGWWARFTMRQSRAFGKQIRYSFQKAEP